MTETNLKTCPFCGGKAKLTALNQPTESWVCCTECGVRTRFFGGSTEDAVSAWNTRQLEDDEVKYQPTSYSCRACKNATDSEIKRLREALEEIQDAITFLNTADVLEHISDKINQTLEGKEQ